jgi:hypothetical protein
MLASQQARALLRNRATATVGLQAGIPCPPYFASYSVGVQRQTPTPSKQLRLPQLAVPRPCTRATSTFTCFRKSAFSALISTFSAGSLLPLCYTTVTAELLPFFITNSRQIVYTTRQALYTTRQAVYTIGTTYRMLHRARQILLPPGVAREHAGRNRIVRMQ